MTATANERLADIKARAEAATEGPWGWEATAPAMSGEHWNMRIKGKPGIRFVVAEYQHGPDNAEFITHARTDVPALVAALEAVLELHQPDWSDWGLDHPEEGAVCSCGHNGVYEECPTVQAINEALDGKPEAPYGYVLRNGQWEPDTSPEQRREGWN